MKRYRYKAKDAKGNDVTGEVEAQSEKAAAKLVRARGLILISLSSYAGLSLNVFGEGVSKGEVANFTRQLATMVAAGLPLTEALVILRSQTNSSLSKIVAKILSDVQEGESLSAAISKYPSVFSKTYIALVKSGEMGGVMDEVLLRLSDDLEKQEEFKGKVRGALIYPVIIIIAMIAVAVIMLVFVVPRLSTLYEQFDAQLPLATRFLIAVSDATVRFWPALLAAAFGAGWLLVLYARTKEGKRKIDETIFSIPIFGELQRQILLTDLTRTLSLMMSSGVSILEALSITSEAINNMVIQDAMQDVIKMVEKGFPLSFSFSRHPEAFPFILSQMIAVGDQTGKMDEVLRKVSHVFEVESDQKVKSLTSAIEPVILVVLGGGVAFLVISIIMPIYNLTTNLSVN